MVSYMKDNGLKARKKAMEDRYGKTDPSMKECGTITWQMGQEF